MNSTYIFSTSVQETFSMSETLYYLFLSLKSKTVPGKVATARTENGHK